MRIAIAAALMLVAIPASAQSPPLYISDVLTRPAYRAAYVRMLEGWHRLPYWMATPDAARRSTMTPGTLVRVDGRDAELFSMCEPHACDRSNVVVLFEGDGRDAKGVVRQDGRTDFLASPSPQEMSALIGHLD